MGNRPDATPEVLPAFPKIHNAAWPGLVGKVAGTENSPIDLDTMLALTAQASVDGMGFDGIDLFLTQPHTSIDSSLDDIKQLADQVAGYGLAVGSLLSAASISSSALLMVSRLFSTTV